MTKLYRILKVIIFFSLGAFAKQGKATNSFVMSVRPSVRTEQLFMKFYISVYFFRKSVAKNQVLSKSDKNNGYFTWRPIKFLITSCPIRLRMNTISDKRFRKIRNAHFIFTNLFFFANHAVFEIMWKTCVERDRTHDFKTHAHYLIDI